MYFKINIYFDFQFFTIFFFKQMHANIDSAMVKCRFTFCYGKHLDMAEDIQLKSIKLQLRKRFFSPLTMLEFLFSVL